MNAVIDKETQQFICAKCKKISKVKKEQIMDSVLFDDVKCECGEILVQCRPQVRTYSYSAYNGDAWD